MNNKSHDKTLADTAEVLQTVAINSSSMSKITDKNTTQCKCITDSSDFWLDALPESLNIVRIDGIVLIPDTQHVVTDTKSNQPCRWKIVIITHVKNTDDELVSWH